MSQLSFQGGGGLLWELSCLEHREKDRTPHSGSQAPGWPPEPETEGGVTPGPAALQHFQAGILLASPDLSCWCSLFMTLTVYSAPPPLPPINFSGLFQR